MTDAERDRIIRELHTAMLGIPGTRDTGLVGNVDNIVIEIKELCAAHARLKLLVYTLIALLVGAGVITGGVLGLPKLIG